MICLKTLSAKLILSQVRHSFALKNNDLFLKKLSAKVNLSQVRHSFEIKINEMMNCVYVKPILSQVRYISTI